MKFLRQIFIKFIYSGLTYKVFKMLTKSVQKLSVISGSSQQEQQTYRRTLITHLLGSRDSKPLKFRRKLYNDRNTFFVHSMGGKYKRFRFNHINRDNGLLSVDYSIWIATLRNYNCWDLVWCSSAKFKPARTSNRLTKSNIRTHECFLSSLLSLFNVENVKLALSLALGIAEYRIVRYSGWMTSILVSISIILTQSSFY